MLDYRSICEALPSICTAELETEAIIAKRKRESTTPYKFLSLNVLTEHPVTLVDKVVDRRGSRKLAEVFVKLVFLRWPIMCLRTMVFIRSHPQAGPRSDLNFSILCYLAWLTLGDKVKLIRPSLLKLLFGIKFFWFF